jgi:hypothetical protein
MLLVFNLSERKLISFSNKNFFMGEITMNYFVKEIGEEKLLFSQSGFILPNELQADSLYI